MPYVLIVITYIGGYATGYGIQMQEFSSDAACASARAMIEKQLQEWNAVNRLRPFCVPR